MGSVTVREEDKYHFHQDISHIVYASDDRFSEILGVSLISLFENSTDMKEIIIYILDSGISSENRNKLEALCKSCHRRLPVWISARNISKEIGMRVAADRGSLSQYARLFVAAVLPQTLKRVLYLDCDIILNQSVRELWNLDMHGKTIAALQDAFSKYYRRNIGLKPGDIMFNSGVMLIDLERWKEQRTEERLLSFIAERKGKIQQADQGALNAILSSDTYCFEPRFNAVTIFYDFDYKDMLIYRKPPEYYTEEEVKKAVEEPVVIHFTTSFLSRRPWVEGCRHRYLDKWLYYKQKSPWADTPLWKYQKTGGIAGIYKQIAPKLPRPLLIKLSGYLQAYGRPAINRLYSR